MKNLNIICQIAMIEGNLQGFKEGNESMIMTKVDISSQIDMITENLKKLQRMVKAQKL